MKKVKTIYLNGLKNIKFGNTESEEYEFNQYKSPILINDIGINKIVLYNNFHFSKQGFKYFIVDKDSEKIDLYSYSVHK